MKTIEKNIISSVFDEESYNKVSFLIPDDFPSKRAQYFWSAITEEKGDIVKVVLKLEGSNRNDLINEMMNMGTVHNVNNVRRMSLLILEMRFKKLLKVLLYDMLVSSENDLEANLLKECFDSVDSTDVFDLSYNINEYLGHHGSLQVKQRVTDFCNYVNKRVESVKECINGN